MTWPSAPAETGARARIAARAMPSVASHFFATDGDMSSLRSADQTSTGSHIGFTPP